MTKLKKCNLCNKPLGNDKMIYNYKNEKAHWHCIMNQSRKNEEAKR